MRILLTGITGFVGRNLFPQLAQKHEVFGVIRSTQAPAELSPAAELIEWDLSQRPDLSFFPKQLDVVIHLAFSAQVFPEHAAEVFATNIAATQHLAELARRSGVRDFIFASTGNVYAPSTAQLGENDPTLPDNYYAFSKLAGESLLQQYQNYFNVKILRLFTPYGPGQRGRMLPNIIERVRTKTPVTLTNGGQPWVSPIYIDDLVQVVTQCLSHSNSYISNVGGEVSLSVKDIAELAAEALGLAPRFEHNKAERGRNFIAKIDLMKSLFSLPNMVKPAEGIRKVIQASG